MRLRSCLSLALAGAPLVACEVPRPVGAYVPDAGASFNAGQYGFESDEVADGGSAPGDENPDSQQAGEADAATDTPVAIVDNPDQPASVLQGRYLMRLDVYSTASATSLGNTLTLKNRVSNLMVADLILNADGSLHARETLCTQSYLHQCVSNCTNWKTDVDDQLPKKTMPRVVERDYHVSASGMLTADSLVMPIGFDEDPARPDLPMVETDDRVWTLVAGSPRYGVNTHLTAKLGPLMTALDCVVATVQRFSSTFGGQLDLQKYGADALVQKAGMIGDSRATRGEPVYVAGTPTEYCNKSAVASTKAAPNQKTVVHFQRYGGAGCPYKSGETWQAAYEDVFPGAADLP
ncbi:MAG: hypothetical protein JWN04_4752 [Myxococcaceae bacterium]|nr:hypothetical protein [Myxococcaceae bacterium]